MKQPSELAKIITDVRNAVDHEEDVLGYKVTFDDSEVKEALQDLGYVLDYKQGSKKEKMFYHLSADVTPIRAPADSVQNRTPADENSMLDEVGGYIISRKEVERYWQEPKIRSNERSIPETSSKQHEPSAESDLEKLFFSYPDKKFLRDLEEDEPETKFQASERSKYWGKITFNIGVVAATIFCVYVLAERLVREIPTSTIVLPHLIAHEN